MNENKLQPVMAPMNREESQRYAGIRQALMNLPDNMADPNRVANPYGVYYPDPMAVQMAEQAQQPVQGGVMPNGGITPGGMPLPAAGDDMAATMAIPQPKMQAMNQSGVNQRGLGRLMAGLSGRAPMMRG